MKIKIFHLFCPHHFEIVKTSRLVLIHFKQPIFCIFKSKIIKFPSHSQANFMSTSFQLKFSSLPFIAYFFDFFSSKYEFFLSIGMLYTNTVAFKISGFLFSIKIFVMGLRDTHPTDHYHPTIYPMSF